MLLVIRNKRCGSVLSRDFAAAGEIIIADEAAPTEEDFIRIVYRMNLLKGNMGDKPSKHRLLFKTTICVID